MRELFTKEMEMVSAAGVINDDPNVKETMEVFDKLCKEGQKAAKEIKGSMLGTSIGVANKTVHSAVNVMDAAYSSLWNSVSKLLGW
mgnify:CR=1 FL=1